jgi:hypothetical protein
LENANTLNIGAKDTLRLFNELEADTTTLLGLTTVDDSTAFDGALAGDAADTGHSVLFSLEGRSK